MTYYVVVDMVPTQLRLCILQLKELVLIRTSSEEMSMFNFDYMCFIFSAVVMIVLKAV